MASFSDLLGPDPNAKRGPGTFSDLLGPSAPTVAAPVDDMGRDYATGPEVDHDIANSGIGRVLGAIGHGAAEGWGTDPLWAGPEVDEALKKLGIVKPVGEQQNAIVKAFNEVAFRPAAAALVSAGRLAFRGMGAGVGAFQGGAAQLGEEVGQPQLGRDIAALPEAFPTGFHGGIPAPTEPAVAALQAARAERVVGESEAAWKGVADPVPANANEPGVGRPQIDGRPPPPLALDSNFRPPEPAAAETAPTEPPALPPALPDVHGVARQIAPDTFSEFDALRDHQEGLRQEIAARQADLQDNARGQAPGAGEIADLERRMQSATPRMAKKYQARLDALRPDYDAFLDDDFTLGALTRETPEIAALRQQLAETEYRMRDLAPDVTEAYRQAAERMPEPEAEPVADPGPAPEPAAEPPTAVSEPTAPDAAAPAEPPPSINIAQDVTDKLRTAGRPIEEARASAQVTEALWRTRAEAFEGRKGTSEEMYAREAPDIRPGRDVGARQLEMAQSDAPARGGAQGKIKLTEDGRSVITLMRSANASTYIHEMGHDWLERMMRDAGDTEAPDAMRKDAATVRAYLRLNDGDAISTKAHEKFARSFERYFMEGRAPTQALANVFARFKEWLTTIYQSVAKLRAPITPDIRDVFDRLLTKDPSPAAVIPESAADTRNMSEPARNKPSARVTSSLADTHEADVANTAAEDAAPVARQVRKEINTAVAEHAPGEVDGLEKAAQSGSEGAIAGSNQPGGLFAEPSDGSVADPGTGGGLGELGAIGEGGGSVAPESGGVAGSGAAATGTGRASEPEAGPSAAARPFGRSDDGLVDKAGNIRLDNLNQPEDVTQVIRDTADQNADFLDARRGVISDASVIDLADALGMTPGDLGKRRVGQAFNAEQVVAARKLLVQSAQAVRDAMAKAAEGSDADVLAYGEARARHLMIQEQVSGVTAEAGRALRAFGMLGQEGEQVQQINEFLQGATGKTLFQMRREAKAGMLLDTPGQVSKFVADSAKPTFGDMAMEYWINGLISGPATHVTYAVGNALLALWKAGPETGAAAAIGSLRRLFGDDGERVYGGEVGAGLYGIIKGQREGFQAAYKAVRTGLTTELPGEGEARAQGSFLAMQPQPRGAIPGIAGEIARLPARGVATIHSYFRAIGYSEAKAQLAYRQAASEGLTADAFTARVAELSTNPPPEMMQAARDAATTQTLMGSGGEFTRKFAELTNTPIMGVRLLKVVDPFVKIGSNVMKEGLLERSPLGLLDPEIRANLMGRNGAIARDTQIARIGVGSALMATSVGLAAQGLLSGGGPADPHEAAMWRLAGNQPYSVRIGDTWYETHRLGPLAMVMGVAADMHEFADAMETHDVSHLASLLVGSVTKGILHESFMRGPADLIQALEDPDRYGARYVRSQLTTLLPFSTAEGQIARAMDPYARQARSLMDAFKARVPGLSETLLPRRDIWGEPVANKDDLGLDGLTSIAESKVTNDPVTQAMMRLHIYPAPPERKLVGVEMTDQQYDDFSRIAGRMTKMRLNALVGQPGFDQLLPGVQTKAIVQAMESSRRSSGELIKMQNPAIIMQAMQARRDMLEHGRPEK